MVQLHGIHGGIDAVRPTVDVDMVLHIETQRGTVRQAAATLESLGYQLKDSIDQRRTTAHRFTRSTGAGKAGDIPDIVDLLIADHPAPQTIERLKGKDMVAIEGGTQALRRTLNAEIEFTPGRRTTLSIPSAFGATILKAAAYQTDSRDRERHLQDAVLLLAVIKDPLKEKQGFTGSDSKRLRTLVEALHDNAQAWLLLPEETRDAGQAALRILTA